MTTPRLFRINLEVGDIGRAASFYGTLLGAAARPTGEAGSISTPAG